MPVEGLRCDSCGSDNVTEYKPNTYICGACDHTFKYVDPSRTEVAPQFCEEGCGNPIKYKCAICGKMVCEGHGEKAEVLLARRSLAERKHQEELIATNVPGVQQAWCLDCFGNMSDGDVAGYLSLILTDSDSSVRWYAIYAFAHTGPAAVPYLCEALKDGNPDVRQAAVQVLVTTGGPAAVPYLGEALKDEDYKVRKAAADALGAVGDPAAVPYLGEALKDETLTVRKAAATALGAIGGPTAVPYLCEALKDENYDVREAAANALGAIGDPTAVPYLCEALKDENDYVRRAAAQTLETIGDPIAVPYLCEALKDKDYKVCWAAADVLEAIGDPIGLKAAAKARKAWAKRKDYRG